MKKAIIMVVLIAGCFSAAIAQQPKRVKNGAKGTRAENMLEHMTQTLSLTTDQQNKIKPILDEAKKNMRENKEKYKGKKKCMAQAKYQNRKATEEKIMAILTPDQQVKWQEEKKKRMEERRKKREEELSKPINCE